MTARELSIKTGLSIGRISQLTKGWRKGEKQYPALLVEYQDFIRHYGRIEYLEQALQTIKQAKER